MQANRQHWPLRITLAIWLALGCAEVPYYPTVEPEEPEPPMISNLKLRCIETAQAKCSSAVSESAVDCYNEALAKCANE